MINATNKAPMRILFTAGRVHIYVSVRYSHLLRKGKTSFPVLITSFCQVSSVPSQAYIQIQSSIYILYTNIYTCKLCI